MNNATTQYTPQVVDVLETSRVPKNYAKSKQNKKMAGESVERQITTTNNPKRKIELLSQLWAEQGWTGAERDFASAEEAVFLAEQLQSQYWIARVGHRIVSCDLHYKGHTERASLLHKAVQVLENLGKEEAYFAAMHTLAIYYHSRGELENTLYVSRKTSQYYERVGNLIKAVRCLSMISMVYRSMGNLEQSLAIAWHIAELGKNSGIIDIVRIAQARLTSAYNDMGEYHKALECNRRIEQIYDEMEHQDAVDRACVQRNMGANYVNMGMIEEALQCFEQALQLFRSSGHSDGEIGVLGDIGVIYSKQGKQEQALQYLMQAEALLKAVKYPARRCAYVYCNIAALYHNTKDVDTEILYLHKALHAAKEGNIAKMQCHVLLQISHAYEQQGNCMQAFVSYKQYTAVQQEMQATEKQRALAEMQTKFEVERLEYEREVQQLRAERLQQEVEYKNKELALLALQVVQKNECFHKIKERLDTLKGERGTPHAEIVRLVKTSLRPNTSWKAFSQQFNAVYQNFYPELLQICPTLTPTELKVCSLLKVGLLSKDIADILFLSVRTIETHRNTIRKKLNLPAHSSLSAYLAAV